MNKGYIIIDNKIIIKLLPSSEVPELSSGTGDKDAQSPNKEKSSIVKLPPATLPRKIERNYQ